MIRRVYCEGGGVEAPVPLPVLFPVPFPVLLSGTGAEAGTVAGGAGLLLPSIPGGNWTLSILGTPVSATGSVSPGLRSVGGAFWALS